MRYWGRLTTVSSQFPTSCTVHRSTLLRTGLDANDTDAEVLRRGHAGLGAIRLAPLIDVLSCGNIFGRRRPLAGGAPAPLLGTVPVCIRGSAVPGCHTGAY